MVSSIIPLVESTNMVVHFIWHKRCNSLAPMKFAQFYKCTQLCRSCEALLLSAMLYSNDSQPGCVRREQGCLKLSFFGMLRCRQIFKVLKRLKNTALCQKEQRKSTNTKAAHKMMKLGNFEVVLPGQPEQKRFRITLPFGWKMLRLQVSISSIFYVRVFLYER